MEIDPATDAQVRAVARRMELFEATASVKKTGTGSRREGDQFETLVGEFWVEFARTAASHGATATRFRGRRDSHHVRLVSSDRSLWIPAKAEPEAIEPQLGGARWLEVKFKVAELITAFPSTAEAIVRYGPASGPFANERYPMQYAGLTTEFDDTIVLEEKGVLREKILLEYKTAKSSKHDKVDGNAHERLSFQVMQYLEVATRYPRCSFEVIGNGAFIRYRNKYHVNFHVQAERLANFVWFRMGQSYSEVEYLAFARELLQWLFKGGERPRSDRR